MKVAATDLWRMKNIWGGNDEKAPLKHHGSFEQKPHKIDLFEKNEQFREVVPLTAAPFNIGKQFDTSSCAILSVGENRRGYRLGVRDFEIQRIHLVTRIQSAGGYRFRDTQLTANSSGSLGFLKSLGFVPRRLRILDRRFGVAQLLQRRLPPRLFRNESLN